MYLPVDDVIGRLFVMKLAVRRRGGPAGGRLGDGHGALGGGVARRRRAARRRRRAQRVARLLDGARRGAALSVAAHTDHLSPDPPRIRSPSGAALKVPKDTE